MVIPKEENLVHSQRLSSVGPSRVTGTDVVEEPTPMDLAMKLHYLRGVYYFTSQASQGVTISVIKETMFEWLNVCYKACGRFKRWPETGRPYIKCNDCGVRFIEAKCEKTVEEWLDLLGEDCALRKLLIYDKPIGPELSFSPPVLIQVTQFKCGGMSLGLSWAHVLGDVISAVDCINLWAQLMAELRSNCPKPPKPNTGLALPRSPQKVARDPVSIKRVDPVGDHWVYTSGCNMETFTFHLTHTHLNRVRSMYFKSDQAPVFESLCTIIWQTIAEVREAEKPSIVTICKNGSSKRLPGVLRNSQKISVVESELPVVGSDPTELLGLLSGQAVEENDAIEEAVERDNDSGDVIIYGANLTFVDLGDADLYGLELKGLEPVFADFTIHGIGSKGVVIVALGPRSAGEMGREGRVVTVTLPEDQMPEVKDKLKRKNLVLENNLN